ncbi:hypothetical protein WMF18_10065 [Sorangium sp. So ce315]|uniref:hypothetical protein n=1 Tax=Sorangium sp. So ce315 TaxID=3133299 RepID=UPI003F5FBC9C
MTAPPSPPLVRAAAPAALPRLTAAVARSIAAAALAAPAAGCLVISPPEYDHPAQTAPVLAAVFPPPHIPIHVHGLDAAQDFGATVLSEDNGDPVLVALYIDYGRRSRSGDPFRRRLSLHDVTAGTIAGGPRPIPVPWTNERLPLPTDGVTPERECHTITLMASHAFNRCFCPADPEDMSSLTWQLINCDPNDPGCPESCPALDCSTTPCLFCDDPEYHEGCTDP